MRIPSLVAGLTFFTLLPMALPAQGLFESAVNDNGDSASSGPRPGAVSISGHVKGAFFGGRDEADNAVVSGSYGQAALKFGAEKHDVGRAFAEIRLTAGNNRGQPFAAADVREAWVGVSPGPFDFKLGRQIVPWGRADAINPTNNITPRDETALSSEYDDTRLGNELLQVKATVSRFSIQGLWIPWYRPDVLPVDGAAIPPEITVAAPVCPDIRFKNGGYALRLEYIAPAVDGSLSYFNGYATLPGFDYSLSQAGLSLIPRAYRLHAAGADFSTAIGSFGLRGEAAFKYPHADYEKNVHVPNPYLQYVLGLDKSIGDWSVLLQYSGLYVIDYAGIADPVLTDPFDPLAQMAYASALASAEIRSLNRLFTGTDDEVSHSVMANIQWNTLHEILHLKIAGMYNFTTRDYVVNPSVGYDIADAISLVIGGRYLDGPVDGLNDMVGNLMSFAYTELKLSF